MRNKYTQIAFSFVAALAAVLVLLWLTGNIRASITAQAFAAPAEAGDSPTVTGVDPDAVLQPS